MDETLQKRLLSRKTEGKEVVSGYGAARRSTGTMCERVGGRQIQSVRGVGSRRGATNAQSGMGGTEDKVAGEVRRARRASSGSSERKD